ncbi:MAG: DEAD/DEAH box helicase [Bacilli bacterium]
MKFNKMIKNKNIIKALTEHNINEPTEIQEKAIPVALDGKDIIALSQTGTGKTLAFMLPILEKISSKKHQQALIICPTRELSMQVYNEVEKYIKYMDDINAICVYGGQYITEQIRKLKKKPQIVIATPGRLIDHLKRKTIVAKYIETVVLDEADEMISIGFKDELEEILTYLPSSRQTLFFSATYPTKVVNLSKSYLKNPVSIKQDVVRQTIDTIEQMYIKVRNDDKVEVLKRFLYLNNVTSIVFCNTKRKVDETVAVLQSYGFIAEAIHGDLTQEQREKVMNKMKKGILDVLVATDVAARGIDISLIGVVYNFDFPDDYEYYVHRIGRTGRAGRKGKSYTFVTDKQSYKIKELCKHTKAEINKIPIPHKDDVNSKRIANYVNTVDISTADGNEFFQCLIDEGYTYKDIAYALIYDKFSENDFSNINDKYLNLDDKLKSKSKKSSRKNKKNNEEVRIFINAGSRDKIKVKHITGALKNNLGIKEKFINDIVIKKEFSFFSIPASHKNDVLRLNKINKTRVITQIAKK